MTSLEMTPACAGLAAAPEQAQSLSDAAHAFKAQLARPSGAKLKVAARGGVRRTARRAGERMSALAARREPRCVRALMLALRLHADAMIYTPLSHRGARAKRLLPRVCVLLAKQVQS